MQQLRHAVHHMHRYHHITTALSTNRPTNNVPHLPILPSHIIMSTPGNEKGDAVDKAALEKDISECLLILP